MNNLCANGGTDALEQYLFSNTLYIESWEKCFSMGLGLDGKICPYEDIIEEKYCSKGSADAYIAFLKRIITECPDHSLDIEEGYYTERLNMINICSKDSDSGKECRNIVKVYKNKPLKKFTSFQRVYWDSDLCKSSCGAEYDTIYKEFGNSVECSKYEDADTCKEFQSGNSACETKNNVITSIIAHGIIGAVIGAIIGLIIYFIRPKNIIKNKNKDNKIKENNNNDI